MIDLTQYLPLPNEANKNIALANEFATPGTVKHFALRLGFLPHNEDDAEQILAQIVREWEKNESLS